MIKASLGAWGKISIYAAWENKKKTVMKRM
jgi:hypothetical protein